MGGGRGYPRIFTVSQTIFEDQHGCCNIGTTTSECDEDNLNSGIMVMACKWAFPWTQQW